MKNLTILLCSVICCTGILFASPIKPIPNKLNVDIKKVELGKKLFFDPILSRDDTISCSTCHDLSSGGDDGLKYPFGIDGQAGHINTPTVYNAFFNFRQFWDGRAKDLKEQASSPIENPIEMGHSMKNAVKKLQGIQTYRSAFGDIYQDGITKENLVDALAEFEKALITPDSPFDRYLKGDETALSEEAKEGYMLFQSKGCIICHQGVNIGGNSYNKFGIYQDANSTELGRYNITKEEKDKYVFKVPSLRNIALTSPYMHDGRFKTLKEAVKFMTTHQLGRELDDKKINAIVEFLRSLTGETPDIIRNIQ